jgi:hypothetical protein
VVNSAASVVAAIVAAQPTVVQQAWAGRMWIHVCEGKSVPSVVVAIWLCVDIWLMVAQGLGKVWWRECITRWAELRGKALVSYQVQEKRETDQGEYVDCRAEGRW